MPGGILVQIITFPPSLQMISALVLTWLLSDGQIDCLILACNTVCLHGI